MFHMKQELLEKSKSDLEQYVQILLKWQKAINLIAPSTINDIWNRHVIDSAQLFPFIPESASILVDMGSGAGFPGLVLAILNKQNQGPLKQIILIESDQRKCVFLQEVIRLLELPVSVYDKRIEQVTGVTADVLTARALAPLRDLLELGKKIITPETVCLFLKGEQVDQEIQNCSVPCQVEKINSITNQKGFILKVTEVSV